jgi:Mn2+/Fe2+ NRAMP family transporter
VTAAPGTPHDATQATHATRRAARGVTLGAAFLMATSAIGPGFLTQTAVFTERHRASFAFAILASILLDLGAQVVIWRTLVATGTRAPPLADATVRGSGTLLTALVCLGGIVFNVGNVAGAGLGLQALFGTTPQAGAALSAAIAVAIFLVPDATRTMDRIAQALGALMIALTAWIAVTSRPPVGEALVRSVAPEVLAPLAIVTLVGGTVGGYIPFAGAHRLLDAGLRGADDARRAARSALAGIGIASAMRILLFLAVLGVVTHGGALDAANPPASAFRLAAGPAGERAFGLVMWAAAITSVIGSAYTSISFLRTLAPVAEARPRAAIVAFIALSTAIFLAVGRPVTLLVLAGALNGLVLPIGLSVVLLAARHRADPGLPGPFLRSSGWLVAAVMAAMGAWTLVTELAKLGR